jgi:peroxiredoxin
VQLNKNLTKFKQRYTEVIAISTDSQNVLARFSGRRGIQYPLLADEGGKIIKAFGLYDAKNAIAHPAVMVVDKQGVIRAIFQEDGYQRRALLADILGAIDKHLTK